MSLAFTPSLPSPRAVGAGAPTSSSSTERPSLPATSSPRVSRRALEASEAASALDLALTVNGTRTSGSLRTLGPVACCQLAGTTAMAGDAMVPGGSLSASWYHRDCCWMMAAGGAMVSGGVLSG